MNLGKEFEQYAIKHRGISSATLHNYSQVTNLTPYIIEERPMNVASMDVFSRLMMDRIIFLGEGINDYVANIVTAQLLFLESTDRTRDIQCISIAQEAVYMQVLAFMIPCNLLDQTLPLFAQVWQQAWCKFYYVQVLKENALHLSIAVS